MIIVVESVILCLLFTLMVYIMLREPIKTLYNYPPRIQERVASLDQYRDQIPTRKNKVAAKVFASDMVSDYHDYWFHIKGFFLGEGLALVICALAGLVVQDIL